MPTSPPLVTSSCLLDEEGDEAASLASADGYTKPGPSRIALEDEAAGRQRTSPGRATGMTDWLVVVVSDEE